MLAHFNRMLEYDINIVLLKTNSHFNIFPFPYLAFLYF